MPIKDWLQEAIQPRSSNRNLNYQERLLNILLSFSIAGFAVINLIHLINWVAGTKSHGLPPADTGLIFIFLFFLFWLSWQGKIKAASWLLVAAYSLPMFHLFISRGADLPAALLLAALIIGLLGLLIGDKLALISSLVIGGFIIILASLQRSGWIRLNVYWRSERNEIGDTAIYALLLLIIALIFWLFARRLKQALKSAQISEENLQREYDLLEIKVIARTEQLHRAEEEKIIQLYRLAEFGRLSSGVFHDLINPLTAISLNLEQLADADESRFGPAQSGLKLALLAAHRMEDLIVGIRKQIQQKSRPTIFVINEEIEQIIQILTHKARQARVTINFPTTSRREFYGDAVKFGQIIINLLANAIEACEDQQKLETNTTTTKEIKIELINRSDHVVIQVSDQGTGIAAENIAKIFEPFFSTKGDDDRGLGLGLSSVKNITEHIFTGKIWVESVINQGSLFTVSLPLVSPIPDGATADSKYEK